MCFGDKKIARSASPGAMPVMKIAARQATVHQRPVQQVKLTKTRPQAIVVEEKSSSLDITWPLDRPDDDSTIVFNPPTPDSFEDSHRPYRYDDGSVPPSQAPSIYSRSPSPSHEFALPEKPIGLATPTPPTPTSPMWRTDSALPTSPAYNPPNFSRPTSPPPAVPPAPLHIKRAPPPPVPERRTLPLARSLSAKIAARPKFSLPENLAPFSMPPQPILKDLYTPPTPPPAMAPPVPPRTAAPERTFSPGRIAAVDDIDIPQRVAYDRIRLFPIPDSIIRSEEGYAEERRRQEIAAALAEQAKQNQMERQSSKHSRRQPSSSSGRSSQGSAHGSGGSEADEEYDAFDSRCPSRLTQRPSSMAPLTQLQSRFSMSSLGSTIRVNQLGNSIDRPSSARGHSAGGMPTFPSRHEAKKARKIWLQQQEEAKRQSAKMGVEGILGWDAGKKQWVTKMTAEEMQLWLEQWKKGSDEKRGSGSARSASSTDVSETGKISLDAFDTNSIHV